MKKLTPFHLQRLQTAKIRSRFFPAKWREQVMIIIFRYVFVYYNRIRVTSFNPGGPPPVAYRERAKENMPKAV